MSGGSQDVRKGSALVTLGEAQPDHSDITLSSRFVWQHSNTLFIMLTLSHDMRQPYQLNWSSEYLMLSFGRGFFLLNQSHDGCPKKAVHTTISLHVSEKHKHCLSFPEITKTPKIFPMLRQQSSWDGLFHEGPSSILKSSVIPGLCCTKGKSPGNFFQMLACSLHSNESVCLHVENSGALFDWADVLIEKGFVR